MMVAAEESLWSGAAPVMRERSPISDNPSPYEIARHIDALHTCIDVTGEKVDQALTKYEQLAVAQQTDRHKSRNRDTALLGGLEILLRERGYEMEFDDDMGLAKITPPRPRTLWDKLASPATVIGTVIGVLGAYKGVIVVMGALAHAAGVR